MKVWATTRSCPSYQDESVIHEPSASLLATLQRPSASLRDSLWLLLLAQEAPRRKDRTSPQKQSAVKKSFSLYSINSFSWSFNVSIASGTCLATMSHMAISLVKAICFTSACCFSHSSQQVMAQKENRSPQKQNHSEPNN